MLNQKYKGLFKDWEVGVAVNVIKEFRVKCQSLAREEFEDLLQECLMEWWCVKKNYDPSSGHINGAFMKKVIKNVLKDMIKKKIAKKRKGSDETVSLNVPISGEDGETTYLDQLPANEDDAHNLRVRVRNKGFISLISSKLSPRQQELLRLLSEEGLDIREASGVVGIPRTTGQDELKRIRAILQDENYRDCL